MKFSHHFFTAAAVLSLGLAGAVHAQQGADGAPAAGKGQRAEQQHEGHGAGHRHGAGGRQGHEHGQGEGRAHGQGGMGHGMGHGRMAMMGGMHGQAGMHGHAGMHGDMAGQGPAGAGPDQGGNGQKPKQP